MMTSILHFTLAHVRCSRVHEIYHNHSAQHCPMLAEVATATLVVVQSAVAAFMLSVMPAEQTELMSWTLLPLIGATIASGGAFCLNTQQEVRKIVIGRCLFALMSGVVGPRFISLAQPWIKELMADPILKVGAGFLCGLVVYILSWWVVKGMYARAAPIAAKLVQVAEERIVSQIGAKVASDAAVVAIGVAEELHKNNPQDHSAAHIAEAIATVAQKSADSQPPTTRL